LHGGHLINLKGQKGTVSPAERQAGRAAQKYIGQRMIQHITPESKNRFAPETAQCAQYL
jgi:hypothetical protein